MRAINNNVTNFGGKMTEYKIGNPKTTVKKELSKFFVEYFKIKESLTITMHSFETRFTSAYITINIWRAYTMMARRWETAAAFYLNIKGTQLYQVCQ